MARPYKQMAEVATGIAQAPPVVQGLPHDVAVGDRARRVADHEVHLHIDPASDLRRPQERLAHPELLRNSVDARLQLRSHGRRRE